MKQAVSVCGHPFGFWVNATRNQAPEADEDEWLYDVVWSTYDHTRVYDDYTYMENIVLVAECGGPIRARPGLPTPGRPNPRSQES